MAILTYIYRAQHQEGTEEGCFTHKCFNRYLLLLNYGISFKHCAVTHYTKKGPLVRSLGAPAHRGRFSRTSILKLKIVRGCFYQKSLFELRTLTAGNVATNLYFQTTADWCLGNLVPQVGLYFGILIKIKTTGLQD